MSVPNPKINDTNDASEKEEIEAISLQNPSDVNALKNILTILNVIKSAGEDTNAIINELKKINQEVSQMIPWKMGCVKDTFYSPVWKGLELLEQILNNPHYKEIVKQGFSIIVKEILELENIIKEIQKLSITSSDKLSETKILSAQKAYGIFGIFLLLANLYRSELNLKEIEKYLIYFLNASSLENNLCTRCGILRSLQALGECSYQLTDPPRLLGNVDQIKKIRDLITHKNDKGQEYVAMNLQKILDKDTHAAQWPLLQAIVSTDFKLLKNTADNVMMKLSQLKELLEKGQEWRKFVQDFIEKDTTESLTLPNINALAIQLTNNDGGLRELSLNNALAMIKRMLSEIMLMEIVAKESGALKDFAFEYCIVNIGAVCKHIVKNNDFIKTVELLKYDPLLQKLRQLDDHRDTLMHQTYERNENSLKNNSYFIMNELEKKLHHISAILAENYAEAELDKIFEKFNKFESKFESTYKKIQHKIKSLSEGDCSESAFQTISNKIKDEEAEVNQKLTKLYDSILQDSNVILKEAAEYFMGDNNKIYLHLEVERDKKLAIFHKSTKGVLERFYRGQDEKLKDLSEKTQSNKNPSPEV